MPSESKSDRKRDLDRAFAAVAEKVSDGLAAAGHGDYGPACPHMFHVYKTAYFALTEARSCEDDSFMDVEFELPRMRATGKPKITARVGYNGDITIRSTLHGRLHSLDNAAQVLIRPSGDPLFMYAVNGKVCSQERFFEQVQEHVRQSTPEMR